MRNLLSLSILGAALLSTACLSTSHRVSKGELRHLVTVAPEQRGDQVRVVQSIGSRDDPPRTDRVRGNTVVYVSSPIWIGGRPHHHNHNHGANNSASGASGAGHVSGNSSGGSGFGNVAKGKKADGKAWMILAVAAGLGLAATEGARYDGWVKVHPMHPVHLIGPYGEHTVVPLAHIDQRTADWAHHAVISQQDGPWTKLGRAPLNRQGFTYSFFLGGGEIPVTDLDADPGFVGHIQFGYFPTKQVGLHLDLGMGWAEDDNQQTIYVSRTSLEVQGFLAKAGPVHVGLFGQIGVSSRFDDGIGVDDNSNLLGAGALMQLELTTRLAITGRVGATRAFEEVANEVGIGLSIY
jgi:hypothetical protein